MTDEWGRPSGLLLRGGRLLDPSSGLDDEGDLLIRDGVIAGVGGDQPRGDAEVVEAKGLWVVPGLMDLHVHLRQPGEEQKETIATGTAAAAAGGFAIVVSEPNTLPPVDTPQSIIMVQAWAEGAPAAVWPKCCLTRGRAGHEVASFAALRQAGAVAASDDGDSVTDERVMREAFQMAKASDMPLTVHVDTVALMERDVRLSGEIGWPVHFSHVSLETEVALLAAAQERGLHVTGEATPHHLTLCADDAPAGDASFRMNPPLRTRRDCEALRGALAAGVLSVIASDHAPHTPEEKARPYEEAPPGVIGLETTLGVVWTTLVHAGLLSAGRAVWAMTEGPARVLGDEPMLRLQRGALGAVSLIDPDHVWTVEVDRFHSKGRNCPFAGWRLRGRVKRVTLRGVEAYRDGEVLAQPGFGRDVRA